MNSKGHLYASLIKSFIRIGGGIGTIILTVTLITPGVKTALIVLASSFVIAEAFGVYEEFKDER